MIMVGLELVEIERLIDAVQEAKRIVPRNSRQRWTALEQKLTHYRDQSMPDDAWRAIAKKHG